MGGLLLLLAADAAVAAAAAVLQSAKYGKTTSTAVVAAHVHDSYCLSVAQGGSASWLAGWLVLVLWTDID